MDPKALEHIFATQGHHLTDEQLEQFILHCRAERARIAAAEAAGKPVRKAKQSPQSQGTSAAASGTTASGTTASGVAASGAAAALPSLDDLLG